MRRFLLLLTAFSLAACAMPRDPSPMMIVKPNDSELSCTEIQVEYKKNTPLAAAKIAKNIESDAAEAERGCLVWPSLPDYKNAEGIEGNALLARNARLRKLAVTKGCDISDYPDQAKPYE